MKNIDIALISSIVDRNIQKFISEIKDICQINCKKVHTERSDFPIFHPANRDYFEYKYYENHLEWYIRKYLVTPILCELLEARGISVCTIANEDERVRYYDLRHLRYRYAIRARFKYSNECFGKDYPFVFSFTINGKNIGVRYSGVCLSDLEVKRQLNNYSLDHVEIIDWDDTDSIDSMREESGISRKYRDKYQRVTLRGFFNRHFTDEIYLYCLKEIRAAVEFANKEIGFHTIPNLSLRYLSDFKNNVLFKISTMPLSQMKYQKFDKDGEPSAEYCDLLPPDDYGELKKRFIDEGLYITLIGNENFAKCFLTSEYLYQIFERGNENYFDYSAVATGYFKSVELLLKKIMDLALYCKGHEELWIKCNSVRDGEKTDGTMYRRIRRGKYEIRQAKFVEVNESTFSTEMGPLIWFVHDRTDGWYISQEGRKIVHECLKNYNQGCRNEHLHKDVINDFNTIKSIRNNTILCLYYLLGGCHLTDIPEMDGFSLGLESPEYDRMYKAVQSIFRSNDCFLIQLEGQKEIKAIRLYDQEAPRYDERGNIQSRIRFAVVDNFDIGDYEEFVAGITKDKELYLSRDCIPDRIWRYNTIQGRVEIMW